MIIYKIMILQLIIQYRYIEKNMITQIQHRQKPQINRFLKDDLTKQLSPQDLSKIKKGFNLYKGIVTIHQFIIIMLQALFTKSELTRRKQEILTFIQMFLLIDIKNLEKIRFQDFTNYLIDKQVNKIKQNQFQLFPCTNYNLLDLQGDAVFPLNGCKYFAVLENSKKEISFIQPYSFKKIKSISLGGNIINNIIYLQKDDVYCIATNDKHLNFYETDDDTLIRRFQTPDTIHYLLQLAEMGILITGCTNGHIYQWSIKKILANMKKNQKGENQREKMPKIASHEQYKLFMVNRVCKQQSDLTCMQYLHSLEILITGCNDSLVRLYQVRNTGLKLMKQLDGHYKGIRGVTVSQKHKIIVTCSFDFDVLVWNAYLDHPIARLEGHQSPLMSVHCPKQYDIIISLDSKSMMKIWSSQKYHLIQNILIIENNLINSTIRMCYKQQLDLVIINTRKLLFYKYSVNYNPKLTDDYDIGNAIKYSPKNLQIYIGSNRSVKVWSIQSGIEKRCFINVSQFEITVLELDDRQRRCFVGCVNGSVLSIDLFSGLVIQKYSSHKTEISFLCYSSVHSLLITGSWDRKIKIHNDTNHLEKIQSRENVLRNINNLGEKQLSGGTFSANQFLIATHCKTNAVCLWDFQRGYLQVKYLLPADICQIEFICPFPLLIASDIKGSIYIFTTKYHPPAPFKLVAQWKNMYSIQKSSQITFIKSNYYPGKKQCQVILGDQYGYIRIINITSFIQSLKISPITAQMVGNKNPYRIQDYNNKGIGQSFSNTHDYTTYNCSNLVPPATIKQKIQIKAHNEKINYSVMINQSKEQMILSSSSDRLVKLWSCEGEQRGTLKQGLKQNKGWMYRIDEKWENCQTRIYEKIKNQLEITEADYLFRKRMDSVPFTIGEKIQETSNEDIYKNLKQIDIYLYKNSKVQDSRLY